MLFVLVATVYIVAYSLIVWLHWCTLQFLVQNITLLFRLTFEVHRKQQQTNIWFVELLKYAIISQIQIYFLLLSLPYFVL